MAAAVEAVVALVAAEVAAAVTLEVAVVATEAAAALEVEIAVAEVMTAMEADKQTSHPGLETGNAPALTVETPTFHGETNVTSAKPPDPLAWETMAQEVAEAVAAGADVEALETEVTVEVAVALEVAEVALAIVVAEAAVVALATVAAEAALETAEAAAVAQCAVVAWVTTETAHTKKESKRYLPLLVFDSIFSFSWP